MTGRFHYNRQLLVTPVSVQHFLLTKIFTTCLILKTGWCVMTTQNYDFAKITLRVSKKTIRQSFIALGVKPLALVTIL